MKQLLSNWRPWLLLVAGLCLLGVYLATGLLRERQRIEFQERTYLTKQSQVIENNLSRQLEAINLGVESIIGELPFWAKQTDGHERALRRLASMVASRPSVRTVFVTDAHGIVKLSNREELVGQEAQPRGILQTPMGSQDPNTVFISAPFHAAAQTSALNVSRVLASTRGRLEGVVTATLDPGDIRILLNSVRYADDMVGRIVHGDGLEFVREPSASKTTNQELRSDDALVSRFLASPRRGETFEVFGGASGNRRLTVLRMVHSPDLVMDKPLVISVSRSLDVVFAEWEKEAWTVLLVYMVLATISGTSLYIYLRQKAGQRISERRLKLATETTGLGIWEFDRVTQHHQWNDTMAKLLCRNPGSDQAGSLRWQGILASEEYARFDLALAKAFECGTLDLVLSFQCCNEKFKFLRLRASPYESAAGTGRKLIGTAEDVTESMRRDADLRIAATAFECQEGLSVTDANGVILRVNKAFSELFGYSEEEVVGHTARLLQSGRHDQKYFAELWGALEREGRWQGEIWNRRKNGEVFPEWLSITAVHDPQGTVTHFVANHTDITLRKAAEDEINNLAFYDPLTLLANRRLLQDRLRQAVVNARRNQNRLALMFVDLDRFKPVNDEFGHQAGDGVLQEVARRMQSCVRESDTVARLGGDEFVVLLPTIDSAHDALGVAGKIHAAFKQPFVLPKGEIATISSCTGIAIFPDHGQDEQTLSRHADAAMYQAKETGRDRFVLFDASTQKTEPDTS